MIVAFVFLSFFLPSWCVLVAGGAPFAARYEQAEKELAGSPGLQSKLHAALGWKIGKSPRPANLDQSLALFATELKNSDTTARRSLVAQALVDEVRKSIKKERLLKWAAVGAGATAVVATAALGARAQRAKRERALANKLMQAAQAQGVRAEDATIAGRVAEEGSVMPQYTAGGSDSAFLVAENKIMPLTDDAAGRPAEPVDFFGHVDVADEPQGNDSAVGVVGAGAGCLSVATGRDVGNKAKNLLVLEGIAQDLGEQFGYKFRVPRFTAISSQAVKAFLLRYNVDIGLMWQNIAGDPIAGAEEVRASIARAFDEARQAGSWEFLFGPEGAELERFLGSFPDGASFMVRSTGNEDTEKIANAGGNETVRVIVPSLDSRFFVLLEAMKKVVVSYVDTKSLSQRKNAGDDITVPPLMSLLIQQRVGEIEGQSLPRCGVMYTDEPQGAAFRAPEDRSRLMLVQAAYGDNELVVNSKGPVDTFIMGDVSEDVYPRIRRKPRRLKARGDDLIWVENRPLRQTIPALDCAMVGALKVCSIACEQSQNGKPQDIEFIIMPDEKVIYLLQMRPLVLVHPAQMPSYIDLSSYSEEVSIRAEMAGVGGAFVRVNMSPQNIVCASTLAEAVNNIYISLSEEKKAEAQIFVVKEIAAVTSHEGNTAMGLKMPVFCLKERYEFFVEQLRSGERISFCADPQAGVLVRAPADVLKINSGWLRYPLPVDGSFGCEALFCGSTKHNPVMGDLPIEVIPLALLRQYLKQLRVARGVDIEKLIELILAGVARYSGVIDTHCSSDRGRYKNLWRRIESVLKRCRSPFFDVHPEGSSSYLAARLYPLHVLEVLLFQQSWGAQHIGQDSLLILLEQALKEKKATGRIEDKAALLSEHQRALLVFAEHACSEEVAAGWRTFVFDECSLDAIAGRDLTDNAVFSELLRMLDDLKLFPQWLHTSFAATPHFADLVREFRTSEIFIRKLLAKKMEMQSCDPRACAHPDTFMKTWGELLQFSKSLQELLPTFVEQARVSGSPLLSGVFGSFLLFFIELFDAAIKAASSSFVFVVHAAPSCGRSLADVLEARDKVAVFGHMIEKYFDFLKDLVRLLKPNGAVSFLSQFHLIDDFIKELSACLKLTKEKPQDADQMVIGNAAVEDWLVESEAGFSAGLLTSPRSYEALFTIFHTALKTIAQAIAASSGGVSKLPLVVQQVDSLLSKQEASIGGLHFSPRRLPVIVDYTGVELKYFVPLRQHSATLKVFYDKRAERFNIDFVMVGPEEWGRAYFTDTRWHEMHLYSYFFNEKYLSLIDTDFAAHANAHSFKFKCVVGLSDIGESMKSIKRFLINLVALSDTDHRFTFTEWRVVTDFLLFYEWVRHQSPSRLTSFLYTQDEMRQESRRRLYSGFVFPYYFGEGASNLDKLNFCEGMATRSAELVRSLSRVFFDSLLAASVSADRQLSDRLVDFSLKNPESVAWAELGFLLDGDYIARYRGNAFGDAFEAVGRSYASPGLLSNSDFVARFSGYADDRLYPLVDGLIASQRVRDLVWCDFASCKNADLRRRLQLLADVRLNDKNLVAEIFARRSWCMDFLDPLFPASKTYLSEEELRAKIAEARLALSLEGSIEVN